MHWRVTYAASSPKRNATTPATSSGVPKRRIGIARRTSSGSVDASSCVSLDDLDARGADGVAELALDPVRALGLPVRSLSEKERDDALCGRAISCGAVRVADGGRVTLVFGSSVVGVWERDASRLRCVANFPAGVSGVRA